MFLCFFNAQVSAAKTFSKKTDLKSKIKQHVTFCTKKSQNVRLLVENLFEKKTDFELNDVKPVEMTSESFTASEILSSKKASSLNQKLGMYLN